MFYQIYIILHLLIITFEPTIAQIRNGSYEIKFGFTTEGSLVPKTGPVVINTSETTEHSIRESSNQKPNNTNRRTIQRFGAEYVRKSYVDTFPEITELENQRISALKSVSERSSKEHVYNTLPVEIERAKETENMESTPKYDETNFVETKSTPEYGPFTVTVPTNPELFNDINLGATEINDGLQNVTDDIDTSVITTDRLSTMTKAYLYALYTVTRIVYKNNNVTCGSNTLVQTHSTIPLVQSEPTVTKSVDSKEITSSFQQETVSYPAEKEPLTINEYTSNNNSPETLDRHFINVYDYLQSNGLTPPSEINVKDLRLPYGYNTNFKLRASNRIVTQGVQKNRVFKARQKNIGSYSQHQNILQLTQQHKIQRFRVVGSSKIPHYLMKRSSTPFTNVTYFNAPYNLASMNADIDRNYPLEKEDEALNLAKGKIFHHPNPISPRIGNKMKNEAIKHAVYNQELNGANLPTPTEEYDDTGDTERKFPYPLITTIYPYTSFREVLETNSPAIRQNPAQIYPWMHTNDFTEDTTMNSVYGYKELKPDEALSEESTKKYGELLELSEPITFPDSLETKPEDAPSTSTHLADNDAFSGFLVKLSTILAAKSLNDLQELVDPFNRHVVDLLDSGALMKLGVAIGSYIALLTTRLKTSIKEIQRQIIILQISLLNWRVMLDDDLNLMLDELDNVYDVGEEEAMQRVLHEIELFPNGGKKGEQIVKDFVYDVILHPMNRITKTSHGQEVFKNIAKVASKYNLSHDKEDSRRKFIPPQIFREDVDLSKETRSTLKRKAYAQRDFGYTIGGKPKHILRSGVIDEDKEVDTESDNNKVEIKIQINNIRHVEDSTEKYSVKRSFRRYSAERDDSDSVYGDILRPRLIKRETNIETKKQNKVKLKFDCEPLPFMVSNKTSPNIKNGTKGVESKMIMYCNNDNNN